MSLGSGLIRKGVSLCSQLLRAKRVITLSTLNVTAKVCLSIRPFLSRITSLQGRFVESFEIEYISSDITIDILKDNIKSQNKE